MRAVAALAAVDVARAAATSAEILGTAKGTEQDEVAEVFNVFLRLSEGPAALAKELAGADLPTDVALLGLRRLDFPGWPHRSWKGLSQRPEEKSRRRRRSTRTGWSSWSVKSLSGATPSEAKKSTVWNHRPASSATRSAGPGGGSGRT